MSRFDAAMEKFNFRKAVVVCLIVSVLAGTGSAGFLAHTFRDRLALADGYRRVSKDVGAAEGGLESMEPGWKRLAASSPDLVDILVLDGENRVVFSAKHSDLSQSGSLNLSEDRGGQNRYLTAGENPDVHFRLTEGGGLQVFRQLLGVDEETGREDRDHYFYEKNYSRQKIYLLSCFAGGPDGTKVYFIGDLRPAAGGRLSVKAAAALAVLLFMAYWVLLALWVYARALRAKMNAPVWGIAALFTNLAGWFVFLLYRQSRRTCCRCGALQSGDGAYCTCCGARLGAVCPRCHRPVNGWDRYCGHCGCALNRGKKDE